MLFRHTALRMRLSFVARLPEFPGWSALPGKPVWVIGTVVKEKEVVVAGQEDKLPQGAGVQLGDRWLTVTIDRTFVLFRWDGGRLEVARGSGSHLAFLKDTFAGSGRFDPRAGHG